MGGKEHSQKRELEREKIAFCVYYVRCCDLWLSKYLFGLSFVTVFVGMMNLRHERAISRGCLILCNCLCRQFGNGKDLPIAKKKKEQMCLFGLLYKYFIPNNLSMTKVWLQIK